MNIVQLIISAFLLYLPAMVANMAPVIAAKYNLILWLNKPIDFGLHIRGTRLFGSHKTIRGVVVAVGAGAITGLMQAAIMHKEIVFGLFLGAVLGFGAITGDVVKSFFKRRFAIAPGSSFIPFDQIDFVIGATIAVLFFIPIPLEIFLTAVICIGIASYLVSSVAIALHFKKTL